MLQRTWQAQIATRTAPPIVTVLTVIEAVAQAHGISRNEVVGPRRHRSVVRPRQMAMKIIRDNCPHLSYPAIARRFGGRDHTTIMHGCRQADILLEDDPEFRAQHDRVVRQLFGAANG